MLKRAPNTIRNELKEEKKLTIDNDSEFSRLCELEKEYNLLVY